MSFKNDFWTMIAQEMETHTMKGSRKSARARKDKWNKLKADFKNISYLKLASGFTYSEKKDVDVNKASQVVWDNAVQDVMPEHATGAHAFWASQSVVGGTVSNEENDGEIEGDSDEEAAMNVNTTGKDSPATFSFKHIWWEEKVYVGRGFCNGRLLGQQLSMRKHALARA
ncbi:hypothetical protein SERLA73DRAFT_161255 [Serpula lacrymans var. lacrymans S7.3]|uniref:Myb/SANT-like domain-containing protein n=1 Tax=Serpula lacrymans var. lacrymans (strain S7.3) TaxID=936435 RepID=F8Q053_SERL3|nr:hypothetical protein SERLA73DRAFT_161255 [Serpula lacrymans var. lacrymans S7.3]